MAYNPALEQLRKQAEQRLYQKRLQERMAQEENLKMKSLFDPILNVKGRAKLGGRNWFETTLRGYQQFFDRNYLEWFRNPGQALMNNLTAMGDTLDYAANLIKAPLIAAVKGENVGTRLADAYGLGDNGRITQNMSELRETIGAAPSGIVGGTLAGTAIGAQVGGPWGALIGAGIGLVAGTVTGVAGEFNQNWANTITDMALEYIVDPANIAGAAAAAKATSNVVKTVGASDDVAKIINESTEEFVAQAAKNEAFTKSINKFNQFADGKIANIDSASSLDTILHASARKSLLAKNPTKTFNRYKTKIMKAYYNDDFDEFYKGIAEIGLFKDTNLSRTQAKQVFDVLAKDAGLSRAYKIMSLFDRFDSGMARKLLKGTPMGLIHTGFKKGITAAKHVKRLSLLNDALTESDVFKSIPQEQRVELFKKFDNEGVRYQATENMDSKQITELYTEMKNNADKYRVAGDTASSAVLSKMADNLVFKNGVHETSVTSVKSSLNFIVKKWVQLRGNMDKIIKDPIIIKAYNNIADLMAFPIGGDAIIDYITRMGYNKELANIFKNAQFKNLALVINNTENIGAHIILAEVLSNIAKISLDADPTKQYVETLQDISKKVVSQKAGAAKAEIQLRTATRKLQSAISAKYDNLKETTDINKAIEIEYNKALLDAGRRRLDLSLKNYLEPKDYNKLYDAIAAELEAQKARAANNVALEEFLSHSKTVDSSIEHDIKLVDKINATAVRQMQINSVTENAQSVLMAIEKQIAEQAINAGDSKSIINEEALKDFKDKVLNHINSVLNNYKLSPDDITLAATNASDAYAAKLYRVMNYLKTRIVEDKNTFYEEVGSRYKTQLAFAIKYYKSRKTVLKDLDNIIFSPITETIGKYIDGYEKAADKKVIVNAIMEYLKTDKTNNIIKYNVPEEYLTGLKNIIPDYFSEMLKELDSVAGFNVSVNSYLANAFRQVKQAYDSALNTKIPLEFNLAFLRNAEVLKQINEKSAIKEIFKTYFKNDSLFPEMYDDLIDLYKIYREIGYAFAEANNKRVNFLLDEFAKNVTEYSEGKWKPFSTYIYLKHHLKDLGEIEDADFKEAMRSVIDAINAEVSVPASKYSNAAKKVLVKGYADSIKKFIDSRLNFLELHRAKTLEDSFRRIITHPESFNGFLNDMTSVIKAVRTLEWITKSVVIKGKQKTIQDIISNIDKLTSYLMDLYKNKVADPSLNINKHVDYGFINKLVENVEDNISNIYDAINEQLVKVGQDFKLYEVKLPETALETSEYSSYIKHISNAKLSKYYSPNFKITNSFKFLAVDNHVVRLVTENGNEALPDNIDIALENVIKADLETKLIFTEAPTPEDVVQIAFKSANGSYNFVVFNESYKTSGNEDLLAEAIVKGEELKTYNPKAYAAFMSGKVSNASWKMDGTTYTIYATSELAFKAMYDSIKNNIVNINGKNYIAIMGQNSTKFDDPVIIKGLNKYTDANLEGIISEDTLPYIRLFQQLAQIKDVFKVDTPSFINTDLDLLLNALKDLPNAKLGDVYEALKKAGLVTDLAGKAHDASFDILMTEEIVKALHKSFGNITTMQGIKNILHNFSNGFDIMNEEQFKASLESIENLIMKTSKAIDNDYYSKMFTKAVEGFYLDDFDMSIDNLIKINNTIEDYLEYINQVKLNGLNLKDYSDLTQAVINIQNTLDKISTIRTEALKGVYGDSLVTAKLSNYYIMDYLVDNYHYTRNSDLFLQLWDIYRGKDVPGLSEFSLAGLVKRYKEQYGSTEAYQMHQENLTKIYNYTERIDAFTKFNIKFNAFFHIKLNTAKDDTQRELYLEAFNRIQDKLFGFGNREETLSFDGWLRRCISDQKKGYLPSIKGDKIKAGVKFNLDEQAVKEELKQLIIAESKLSDTKFFKDVVDDFNLLDSTGNMYRLVLNYINDCIDNIGKYNIYNREGNALTLLKPVADRQYWNAFRNAYHNIIDQYKYVEGGVSKQEVSFTSSLGKEGLNKIISPYYDAENELISFMEDARRYLSDLKTTSNKYKALGQIPEGYLNETLNKNTWKINASHGMVTFKHTDRTANYYINTKIRDLFYDSLGVKFDPRKNMDVITYKKSEPAAIKAIQALRDDSGLYINELYEIINEFNIKNMDYKLPKVYMYADIYDRLTKNYPNNFKVYSNFKEQLFNTTFGYLSKSIQEDDVLRANYDAMFKAIAATAYISKVDDSTVYDTLKGLSKEFDLHSSVAKSFKEIREQILGLFKKPNGTYDYDAMYYYITKHNDLEFVYMYKSDKYFKKNKAGELIKDEAGNNVPLSEIHTVAVKSPKELQFLLENKSNIFSIMDKHTIAKIKDSIGHRANNRVYKSSMLNRLVALRNIVSNYVMAPMKSLSLYNIGFTVTNLLEGMFKTFTSTTGNRWDTFKQYTHAIRMHKNWTNLTNLIAHATQGSLFNTMRNQLQLLYYEDTIGKTIFKNWEEILNGAKPEVWEDVISKLDASNLPKFIRDKLIDIYKSNHLKVDKFAERFKRVHKTVINELPKYNLDEYKITSDFINSPASAAEFQNIKKSAELNIIGKDKNDNIIQQALNKFLYSDKWMGENNPLRAISPYANLSRNSDIELINRLAMYLDLGEKGFTKNEALNKVLATHFNYGNKSQLELSLELLIPFISFPLRNFLYWSDALNEHPELLKIFIDMVVCNWGDEMNNPYNQTKITKGGIRLWGDVAIESGLSTFDAMALGGNALNVLTQRKLNPLVSVAIEGAKQLTVGQSNLNYRLQRLPIISHGVVANDLVNSLQKGKVNLYDIAPSLFNEVYKNNRYYYNNQGRYAYKSAYSRLYTVTGFNRFSSTNKANAIKNRVIR